MVTDNGPFTGSLAYCFTGPSGTMAPARTYKGIVARSTARVTSRPPVNRSSDQRSYQTPVGRYRVRDFAAFSVTGATSSSPVSSAVEQKPPMSVPQYGTTLRLVLIPTATWFRRVAQVEFRSPDHNHPPIRCMPAKPVRCSAYGRTFGRSRRGPSQYIRI